MEPVGFDATSVYFLGGQVMTWQQYKDWEDTQRQLDYEQYMIDLTEGNLQVLSAL